jgi:carbon-monoxide dehydrogenase medium subunit
MYRRFPTSVIRVDSWQQAVAELADDSLTVKIISGGQSLMPMIGLGLVQPERLIDVGAIQNPGVTLGADGTVTIPAQTTYSQLLASDVVRESLPLLASAVALVGNIRVRNRGTIGGSLAHADAASEACCALICYGATIEVLGPDGPRVVRAQDFFTGYLSTVLGQQEVVTSVHVPVGRDSARRFFAEISTRGHDFAIGLVGGVSAAGAEPGARPLRVVIGGVAPSLRLVELDLAGSVRIADADRAVWAAETASAICRDIKFQSDVRASAEYRHRTVVTLFERALLELSGPASVQNQNQE